MSSEVQVEVAIIGAGVAGLALANMLEQANISYSVLESYRAIAPPGAASIGLMPNGLRILDQLGVYEKLMEHAVPHDYFQHRDGDDGTLYGVMTAGRYLPPLLGYSSHVIPRQTLLKILYENLPDKSKVRTSSRVSKVETSETNAVVTTEDGFKIRCDIVAGVDGVHSAVRREIEAYTGVTPSPGYLASRSACIFGCSNRIAGITGGQFYNSHRKNTGLFILTGKDDKPYWFLFDDFKEPIKYKETPKYTLEYVQALAEKSKDIIIIPGVTFGDLYAHRRDVTTVSLEEGIAPVWHAGRMFLAGDSCHKMVPNGAMGGNQAIESVASFVNHYRRLRARYPNQFIPLADLNTALESYTNERRGPVTQHVEKSCFLRDALLKRGPNAEGYLQGLSKGNIWEGLNKLAEPMSRAIGLEDWHHKTERAEFYERQAAKMREGLAIRSILEEAEAVEGQTKGNPNN
uniref:FAD-binding domain-containing protein n=1 Tax=Bionectria ochroleuca TaxID=29856 RepID=A0A8H7K9I4_BIOOC